MSGPGDRENILNVYSFFFEHAVDGTGLISHIYFKYVKML